MRVREKLSGLRAVTYGPFAPGAEGCAYAARLGRDVPLMRELGANAVRLYEVPSVEVLDLLGAAGLGAVVTLPWSQHVCFLEDGATRKAVEREIDEAIGALPVHPVLRCVLVGNEIPADVVRWHGERRVSKFLDGVIRKLRAKLREVPLGYASFPTTEGLLPDEADFLAYNIFLESEDAWRRYLDHLSGLGHERPLLVTELGFDSGAAGEMAQADFFERVLPVVEDAAVLGVCLFSFTDEWWRGGEAVTGWKFGLTREDRSRKRAFGVVRDFWAGEEERFSGQRPFCVAVCARNAARTLQVCLESLGRLCPAPKEVLIVDDGSTDETAEMASAWAQGMPSARVVRMGAAGLSAARNRALNECKSEFIVYTDADCEVPERWLEYLWRAFFNNKNAAAAGGANFAPRNEEAKSAALNAAPGTACHVLLEDRRAEHLPGCNMAFRAEVLRAVGGFDAQFHTAGDDVDVCWRLSDAGYDLAFHPAAWVWHFRRGSLRSFWRQQRGYGAAESVLRFKHPERFGEHGGARWRGVIYPWSTRKVKAPVGVFGGAGFQSVYPAGWSVFDACLLSWDAVIFSVLCVLLGIAGQWWALCLGAFVFALALWRSARMAGRVALHTDKKNAARIFLTLIFLTQKIARDFGSMKSWVKLTRKSLFARESKSNAANSSVNYRAIWSDSGLHRVEIMGELFSSLRGQGWCVDVPHSSEKYDLRVWLSPQSYATVDAVTEWYGRTKTLNRIRVNGKFEMYRFLRKMVIWGAILVIAVLFGLPSTLGLVLFFSMLGAEVIFFFWNLRRLRNSVAAAVSKFTLTK